MSKDVTFQSIYQRPEQQVDINKEYQKRRKQNKDAFGTDLDTLKGIKKAVIKKLEGVDIVSVADYLSAKKKVFVDELELSVDEISSISVAVDKFAELHVIFENKLWLLFYKFLEKIYIMNTSSSVEHIFYKIKGNEFSKKLDGFFVSNDIAFFCEVTTDSDVSKKVKEFKALKSDIDKIDLDNIICPYPQIVFKDLTVVWIFLSKNPVNDIDKKRLESAGICLLTEDDIDYMENVIKQYNREAYEDYTDLAFTNFVRNVLNLKIKSNKTIEVPAIRYKFKTDGLGYCYSIVSNPSDLLSFCSVVHIRNRRDLDKTYQRFVTPGRLKDILAYIDNNGKEGGKQFANNIILSSESLGSKDSPDKFFVPTSEQPTDPSAPSEPPTIGVLKLPTIYGDMQIIDGQHRLFSYHTSRYKEQHFSNILLFDHTFSDEKYAQMTLFKDINQFQTSLNKNHIWELFEFTLSTKKIEQRISAFFNKALKEKEANFLLYNKIQMGTRTTTDGFGKKGISLSSISETMKGYKRSKRDDSLFDYLMKICKNDEKEVIKLFNHFLQAIKENAPFDWNSNGQGILLYGGSFPALLKIFREILYEWDEVDNTLEDRLRDKELHKEFGEIFKPIFDAINELEEPFPEGTPDRKKKIQKIKTEYKTNKAERGDKGVKLWSDFFARKIRTSKKFKQFGEHLIIQDEYKPWYNYCSQILHKKVEQEDVEAKARVFIDELDGRKLKKEDPDDKKIIEEKARRNLANIAGMYNRHGGFIVIGIEDKTWKILGADNEIKEYGGIDKWQQKIMMLIDNCSEKKLSNEVEFLQDVIKDEEGKLLTVVGIKIRRAPDKAIKDLKFAGWKIGKMPWLYIREAVRNRNYKDEWNKSKTLSEQVMRTREGKKFLSLERYHEEAMNRKKSNDFDYLHDLGYRIE